jgi:antitoxin ParD1/3/4
MTTLTISLPDSLKEFIDREVEAKGYGNVSEYVRGLLREAQTTAADARLEALLIEGLAKGKNIPISPKFWSALRRDAANVLAKQKRPGKARPRSRKIA